MTEWKAGWVASESRDAVLWVHGMPARSMEQVASYLRGDAHDQSKVQVYVGGQFYDVALTSTPSRQVEP